MIYFNGIELDYYENTINKLVVKRSLTDIETLSKRKGTGSTGFDVPRTPNNEKAFGLITTEGSLTSPVGVARLELDGNTYSKGTIKVLGYNDSIFKCLFLGEDMDVINLLKQTNLKDVVSVKFSESFAGSYAIYTDANVKSAMGNNITTSQLDYCYNVAQGGRAQYNINMVTPFFTIKSIINKMFSNIGLTVVSDFMSKELPTHLFYSNFEGTHLSSNLLEGATTTITTVSSKILDLGAVNLGNGLTQTGNKYYFVDSVEKLNLKLNINVQEDSDVSNAYIIVKVSNSADTVTRFSSAPLYLLAGDNDIKIESQIDITAGDYLTITAFTRLNVSLPINYDVVVKDVTIQHDNIQSSGIVLLNDYLNRGTQLEFFRYRRR
mgnify:FL=1